MSELTQGPAAMGDCADIFVSNVRFTIGDSGREARERLCAAPDENSLVEASSSDQMSGVPPALLSAAVVERAVAVPAQERCEADTVGPTRSVLSVLAGRNSMSKESLGRLDRPSIPPSCAEPGRSATAARRASSNADSSARTSPRNPSIVSCA
eukprot:scaffold163508_cov27-Tisochrysis_lutea.AAC.5